MRRGSPHGPSSPFSSSSRGRARRFPTYPPYGDPEHVPVPHCTLGVDDDPGRVEAMVRELRAQLRPSLPIRCRAAEVSLVGELADGTWITRDAFPFEGSS